MPNPVKTSVTLHLRDWNEEEQEDVTKEAIILRTDKYRPVRATWQPWMDRCILRITDLPEDDGLDSWQLLESFTCQGIKYDATELTVSDEGLTVSGVHGDVRPERAVWG